MNLSGYYLTLILPAFIVAMALGSAFRARDLMDDNWRGLGAVTFALTFPGWLFAAHTSSHFILAALGRAPWSINGADLMTVGHYLLTGAQCSILAALVIGSLARSWFLLGMGLVNAVPVTALMLLDTPGVVAAMVYWVVATSLALRAWSRMSPVRARASGT